MWYIGARSRGCWLGGVRATLCATVGSKDAVLPVRQGGAMYHVHRQTGTPPGTIPIALQEGSVLGLTDHPPPIGPGSRDELARLFPDGMTNHGRQYMTTFPQDQGAAWATEALLEAIRRAEHPDKPSRMTSVFAFETIPDARAFVGRYGLIANRSMIFEIDGNVLHRANMELTGVSASLAGAFSFAAARAYWLGEQGPAPALWELLLEPPITLGRVVDADVR